jgi:hypothetical protein
MKEMPMNKGLFQPSNLSNLKKINREERKDSYERPS